MRRSIIPAMLIGSSLMAPLPAMAQNLKNLQALQHAWSICGAPKAAADERLAACNTVIASDRPWFRPYRPG